MRGYMIKIHAIGPKTFTSLLVSAKVKSSLLVSPGFQLSPYFKFNCNQLSRFYVYIEQIHTVTHIQTFAFTKLVGWEVGLYIHLY